MAIFADWKPKRRLAAAPTNPLEAAQNRRGPACPAGDTAKDSARSKWRVALGEAGRKVPFIGDAE